jgi:hypothetical protein
MLVHDGVQMRKDFKPPPLPPLPVNIPILVFDRMFFISNAGEIYVTRNFSNACPVWKKYKRLGWALRYLGGA